MNNDWIEKQWDGAKLGDKRLVQRAIKIGQACLTTPDGTLPEKFGGWSNTKGAYRFFDHPEVTHEALQEVHNKNVIQVAAASSNLVLFIQDGSELIYNKHPCTNGLGPTADACGQGIMFHTCLAVEWTSGCAPLILGVAKQVPWIRPEQKEEKVKKKQEDKESQVWLEILKAIGEPPINSRWVSVGDRGNDIYEYIEGATRTNWKYVLRAKHNRTILVGEDKKKLHEWIRSLQPRAEYELDLRSRGAKFARKAKLKIAWEKATMLPPQGTKGEQIEVTHVRAYDPEDPDLEWIITTSLEVNSAEDALLVVQIYEQRWTIEEYHKCLKTGCRIEDAQLKTGKRLLALLGILGVIATELLRLRDISRQEPDRLAQECVTRDIIDIVTKKYKLEGPINVRELWRRIAMLGGFLGRKSDGEPGWQTIWKGWLRIQDMREGMVFAKSCG